MEKTIEVHSTIIGKLGLTTRNGDVRSVVFSDRGDGIGKAMIDSDEAEILLSGNPTVWKPSFAMDAPPTPEPLTVDGLIALSVAKLTEAIAACDDTELLQATIDAEVAGKNRVSFVNALQDRLDAK